MSESITVLTVSLLVFRVLFFMGGVSFRRRWSLSDNQLISKNAASFNPHSNTTFDSNSQVEHYGNGGFTVLLNDDIQWDIRAGVGLNDAADDYFLGTGLSIRYRNR